MGIPEIETEVDSDRRSLLLTGAAAVASFSLPAAAIADAMAQHKGDTMNQHKGGTTGRVGTVSAPNFYEGIAYSKDDFKFHLENFTYMTGKGPVAGIVGSVMFTLDRPAKVVWPYLKDFNSFEGPHGIKYTGEDGSLVAWGDLYTSEEHDLGQKTLKYGGSDNTYRSVPSRVLRVVPEHLLVLFETIPADGSTDGMSPGFHTFTLVEHDGKSTVTGIMEHVIRTKDKTEEEALARSHWGPKQYNMSESLGRWKDDFVPTLRALVRGERPRK